MLLLAQWKRCAFWAKMGHEPCSENVLERVASWPAEDQEDLSELARDIEARRSGVYRLSDEERSAIDAAPRSPLASNAEVEKHLLELVGKLEWDKATTTRQSVEASRSILIFADTEKVSRGCRVNPRNRS